MWCASCDSAECVIQNQPTINLSGVGNVDSLEQAEGALAKPYRCFHKAVSSETGWVQAPGTKTTSAPSLAAGILMRSHSQGLVGRTRRHRCGPLCSVLLWLHQAVKSDCSSSECIYKGCFLSSAILSKPVTCPLHGGLPAYLYFGHRRGATSGHCFIQCTPKTEISRIFQDYERSSQKYGLSEAVKLERKLNWYILNTQQLKESESELILIQNQLTSQMWGQLSTKERRVMVLWASASTGLLAKSFTE